MDVRANQTQIVRTQRGYFYAGLPKIPPTCILNPPPLRKKRRTKRVYASVATRHSIQRIKFATSTNPLSLRRRHCHFDEGEAYTTLKNFSEFRQLVLKSTNLWDIFTKQHTHPPFLPLYLLISFELGTVFGVVLAVKCAKFWRFLLG